MRAAGSAFSPGVHASGGARGQKLGHHTFLLSLEDYLMDQYYIQCDTNINLKLCM